MAYDEVYYTKQSNSSLFRIHLKGLKDGRCSNGNTVNNCIVTVLLLQYFEAVCW